MNRAAAGRLILVCVSAFAAGVATTARAASIGSTYDMDRLLNEPHPLAHEYGTRWRPAPVPPRPPAPQPAPPMSTAQPRPMPPPAPPVAIAPPAMLPAPPAPAQSPAAGEPITPYLTIDDPSAPKAPASPPAAPASQAAAPAQPPPALPPTGRARQRTAGTGPSTVRVGARPERGQSGGKSWISEVRVGALYHDQGPFSRNKEEGVDANVELLFASPDFLKIIWSPRPHVGGNLNTKGDTSQAYLGLSWEWEFWRVMFGGFSLGGAVHDGKTTNAPLDRKELGCRVLFRESIELGFRFAERHSISGFLDHISNAKLCSTNEGLENAGIRYGYKF